MSGADKRGQLSSGLLGAKGTGTEPAAHGTGALKLASDPGEEQPIESADRPPPEPKADILYTKGDASASTFRPSYWTFERQPNEAGSGATVTPINAAVADRIAAEAPAARTTPPAKPLWYRRTANIAVLSFSGSALLASAAFFVLSLQHQAPSLPVADSVPTSTASAPASPPTSPVRPIVGVLVPLPDGAQAAPAASEPSTAVATAPAPSALSEPSIPPVPSAPPVAAVASTPAPAPVVAAPAPGAAATVTPAPNPVEPTPSAAPVQPSAPPAAAAPVVAAIPQQAPAAMEAPAASAAVPKPETASSAPTGEATQDALPLIARGDELRFVGDFTAARLFYERAAEQGSAEAARAVGETYDPFVLEEAHALGVRADARTAANWYRKAIEGGDTQAAQRLQRLMTKPAN